MGQRKDRPKSEVAKDAMFVLPPELRKRVEDQNAATTALMERSAMAAVKTSRADAMLRQHQMLHSMGVDHQPCEEVWQKAAEVYREQAEVYRLTGEMAVAIDMLEQDVNRYMEGLPLVDGGSSPELSLLNDLMREVMEAEDRADVSGRLAARKSTGDIS
jgi:hypothetical protein